LKALGYFVREFEAQPAEEYLRRTTQLNKIAWITEIHHQKNAQDPKGNWNKSFFGIRRRVK
jgi:hypothetical protein